MKKYLSISMLLLFFSCGVDDLSDISDSLFSTNQRVGSVEGPLLREVSGIAYSRSMDDALWVHNDRGDGARIFLLHESGRHLGTIYLDGIAARDWEDIAIGPGPEAGRNYIYIADIGNNDGLSQVLYVYRFLEPSVDDEKFPFERTIEDVDIIEVVYPDKSRDAETLLVDPLTSDILIVTKSDNSSEVFSLPYPQSLTNRNRLRLIGELPFDTAVGGDVSADGTEVLIKNYDSIYYWEKSINATYTQLFREAPTILPYQKEPQGEAIGWKFNGLGYYTIGEQVDNQPSPIYFYRRN